jgi:hypothetical protein
MFRCSMPDAKDVAGNLISRVHEIAVATQPVKICEMLEQYTPKPRRMNYYNMFKKFVFSVLGCAEREASREGSSMVPC